MWEYRFDDPMEASSPISWEECRDERSEARLEEEYVRG